MKNKTLVGWITSAVLFGISTLGFLLLFLIEFSQEIIAYILFIVPMIIFAIVFLYFDKKMKARTEYTKFESAYFYKKCARAGVNVRVKLLTDEQKLVIKNCAQSLEYFSHFDMATIMQMYSDGLKQSKSNEKSNKAK